MITFLGNGKNNGVYGDIVWRHRESDKHVIVSCQYPHLIPKAIVNGPFPVVNIHYGLLPFYRGVNPIYWQMMTSDVVGVTLHYVDEKFDTGDIIDTYSFPHHGKTADECYKECERQGAWMLNEWIERISNGAAAGYPQGTGKYYKKGDVNWAEANKIHTPFFDPKDIKRIFATHFEGKQYPEIEIGGRTFELRAK